MASTSAAGQAHPCGSNLLFVRFDPQPKSAAARSRNSNKKWPRSPGTGGVWWGQELPEDPNSYMSQAALIEAWLSPVSSARVPASMARCWLVQVQWGPLRYWWLCRQGFWPSEGGASEAQTPRDLPCRPELMPWRSEVMASEGPMWAQSHHSKAPYEGKRGYTNE